MQRQFNLGEQAGVLVVDIEPNGSAAKSKIQKMDIIKEVRGAKINSIKEYLAAIEGVKKGQTILLLIQRDSKPLYVAVDVE